MQVSQNRKGIVLFSPIPHTNVDTNKLVYFSRLEFYRHSCLERSVYCITLT